MATLENITARTAELFRNISFTAEPSGLYDPLRYMIAIGGKRLRPALCLLTYSIYKDSFDESILEPAAALEVFHTFTLIHDDIMDRSPLRRGQATVWKKWDEDTAILSGDVMQIDAYRRIAKAPADKLADALALFTETAAQVCEGQQYDMDFENENTVAMNRYMQMIGLKTAVLIACAAKMGAIIGGATDEEAGLLYNFGYALGLAFQVADDYLDAYGDEKVFGKPIGGDIVNGKKSWLTVKAFELAPEEMSAAMSMPVTTPEECREKIDRVKALYTALGIDKLAAGEIQSLTDESMEYVSRLGLSNVRQEMLKRFADKLVGRRS